MGLNSSEPNKWLKVTLFEMVSDIGESMVVRCFKQCLTLFICINRIK